ncbi:MAG: YfhO family protein [Paraprevotella sp.]|nr:YfhO family protein [Paraprevotella sp.]
MNTLKRFLPDAAAVLFFVAVAFVYFFQPVTEGLVLSGHDHTGGVGAGVEMQKYRERTGERTRWTNTLFSGMPTYQMAPSYDSTDLLAKVENVYQLGLPNVMMYVFILLLGFYILLRAFDFRAWMAVLGAVLWAFSSYFFIIIGAGHIWKLMVLAFIPPTVAGMALCYRGHYLRGALVTAFFMALQIFSNHVQMTYYFLPVMFLMSLAWLIEAVRKRQAARWFKATGVIVAASLLGVTINLSNLYHTYEYSKESMRGRSELTRNTVKDPANQTESGLDRDYITAWSYGIGETWTLLVPNTKGGASQLVLGANEQARKKAKPEYSFVANQIGQYWGEQPGTSGPVYVGAFVLMLFVLGIFIVRGPMKWCLLAATILSVLLSWGHNFMWFTDLFIDYVPMYNKFRTVASVLVVAEFTIPLLAMLALKRIVDEPDVLKRNLKYVYISFGLTGGMALLFALMPDVFFGTYISQSEIAMLRNAGTQSPELSSMLPGIMANIEDMRRAIFVADAWRSCGIVTAGLFLLLAYNIKKLSAHWMVGGILILCLADMWQVNKRYLNDGMFVTPRRQAQAFEPSPIDQYILQDPETYYRVLNLASNTFNENNTSYYHKSVGGYHPAKLRRYQEVIDEHIQPERTAFMSAVRQTNGELEKVNGDSLFPVLDMLNVKYVILPLQDGSALPVENPHANGNGWFVDELKYAADADEEITALHNMNPAVTAIADKRFADILGEAASVPAQDSLSQVTLTAYDANALTYEVQSSRGGVIVFSEIYYPGWQATVDGTPVEIARADYILRAIRVEPGRHKVEFRFDPHSLHVTETIAYVALTLLLLLFLATGYSVYKNRQKE